MDQSHGQHGLVRFCGALSRNGLCVSTVQITQYEELRQRVVAIPREAEALVHFRDTVERAALCGLIDPVVAIDADMASCFCTLEWEPSRAAVEELLPGRSKWQAWCQQSAGEVVLPSGGTRYVDQGAEQGEPTTSASTSAVLGSAARAAHLVCNPLAESGGPQWSSTASRVPLRGRGVCDQWYADNCQIFAKPSNFKG